MSIVLQLVEWQALCLVNTIKIKKINQQDNFCQ